MLRPIPPEDAKALMLAASNLDVKESYWNWLGKADDVEIYRWIRSEEVRTDFNAQAVVNGKKVCKTYTVY